MSEFRKDFPARSWELYVLALLARSGAKLVKSPRDGPDFCATLPDGRRFWVECIVPGHGKGEDAVPLPPSSDGNGRRSSGTVGPSARVAPSGRKHGASEVSTQIFLTDASASIAGVLCARRSIFNLFPVRTRLAYLAHNPRAHVGFPLAALPLRGEVRGRAAARSRGDALAAWPARTTTPLPRLTPFTRDAGVAAPSRWVRSSPAPSA